MKLISVDINIIISLMTCYLEGKLIKLPPFILYIIQLYVIQSIKKNCALLDNNECCLMSLGQRYRAAKNDKGRHTKGIEWNRREANVVHIQLCQTHCFHHKKLM